MTDAASSGSVDVHSTLDGPGQFAGTHVTATADARASHGNLGVSASVAATGGDYPTIAYGVGNYAGQAWADWLDEFTVESPTLAAGTPVPFAATIELVGSMTLPSSYDYGYLGVGDVGATVRTNLSFVPGSAPSVDWLFVQANASGLDLSVTAACHFGSPPEGCSPPSQTGTPTATIFLQVGSTYSFAQRLTATAGLFGAFNTAVSLSYYNSAHFYLDPVQQGYYYTTGSGTSYASPPAPAVPEPASLTLLGLGLAGLTQVVRRRR